MADTETGGADPIYFNEVSKNITEENGTTTLPDNADITDDTNGFYENIIASNNSSPQSSLSNQSSAYMNGTAAMSTRDSTAQEDDDPSDSVEKESFQLRGGQELLEESRTELNKSTLYTFSNDYPSPVTQSRHPSSMASSVISLSNGSGTAKARAAKSPYSSPSSDTIPEEEINVPNDANISSYTCDQLANFLRCFNVEKRIISHLYRKQVDGKRFSKLRDSELESLGMKNPAIMFFRDKSNVKAAKKKHLFVL